MNGITPISLEAAKMKLVITQANQPSPHSLITFTKEASSVINATKVNKEKNGKSTKVET